MRKGVEGLEGQQLNEELMSTSSLVDQKFFPGDQGQFALGQIEETQGSGLSIDSLGKQTSKGCSYFLKNKTFFSS